MAIITNSYETFDATGIREDLTDVIYNISPTETPFMSNIGRTKAKQRLHEWQTDSLATAADNVQIEGEDYASAGLDAATATTRLQNVCQISAATVIVTGTNEASQAAGRGSELAYQIAKKAKELKRDIEFGLSQNGKQVTGSTGTGGESRGLEHWIQTNVSSGGSYSYTNGTTDLTDGTQRNLTEALAKDAIQQSWTSGGDPEMMLCGPVNKQNVSSQFAGIATLYRDNQKVGPAVIIGAADIYVSDFGQLQVVPSRFSRDRTISIIQRNMWAVAYLRPFKIWELAKTGDAEQRLMLSEYCLESRNEAASGKVADLNTSVL